MERGEPTLVPEWYKGSCSGVSGAGGSGSNHNGRSSSGELGIGLSPRNRQAVSACNRDSTDRSSSSIRQSSISNGSLGLDKDPSTHLRPYGSFGRSNRDRDRENGLDFFDREKSSSTEKTSLTHSRSMVSGRPGEWSSKKPLKDLNNGAHSQGSVISGISKASFERDFPSLGAEDNQFHSEPSRISSSGPSTAIQSLPRGASTVGNDWTSPLAQAPNKVGGKGTVPSSALQTAPVSPTSTASSTSTGLKMTEALLQAPLRVRNTQVSVDAQRKDELTRKQYTKLIPVRPLMSKSSILNTTDKSKSKIAKGGDVSCPPKVRQQPSSQLVNQAQTPARSDIPKTSQAGNFLVLNRERNGSLHAAKDGGNPINGSGVATPVSGVSSAIAPSERSINPKVKADIKGDSLTSTQRTFGEKRPLSQARNRNDFFNSLRKKTSGNRPATTEPSCIAPSHVSDKLCLQNEEISSSSNLDLTGNQEPQKFTPDNTGKSFCSESSVDLEEEEAAFLRSLGWEENTGEEALTAEEIDAFVKEYEKLRPSSKLSDRELWTLKAVRGVPGVGDEAGSSSAWSMSGSEQEA